MFRRLLGAGLLLLFGGCLSGPTIPPNTVDTRPVGVALGAAAIIGQSSSIAIHALAGPADGGQIACASSSASCSSFPCNVTITITEGTGCPMPIGGAGTGTVAFNGNFQSANQGTGAETITNVIVDGGSQIVVASASSLTVSRSGGGVTVTYVGQNVNTVGSSGLAAQSTWTVTSDDNGTPNDPSDDRYTVDGTQQTSAGTGTSQLVITSAVLDPTCRKNPVSGSAFIQSVSADGIQQGTVTFHAACDGKADVAGAAVDLNFYR